MTALICLDWDGTISDSWPIYVRAANEFSQVNNLPLLTEFELRHAFGNTEWEGHKNWGTNYEAQNETRFKIYAAFYALLEKPENQIIFFGIKECIERISSLGCQIAIATSRNKTPLLAALNHHGLTSAFKYYLSQDCAKEKNLKDKPAPDMIMHLIERTGADPKRTIMIGDTHMDIRMAHNAKVHSIAVGWGIGQEKNLRALNPTRYCEQPNQLYDTLLSLELL